MWLFLALERNNVVSPFWFSQSFTGIRKRVLMFRCAVCGVYSFSCGKLMLALLPSWSQYLFYVVHCLRGGCQRFLGLAEEWHCGRRPRQTHRRKSWNFSHTKTIRYADEISSLYYVCLWSVYLTFSISFITSTNLP